MELTSQPVGFVALAIFFIAYGLVILEETTRLRKSQPMLVAAGLIWFLIGVTYTVAGRGDDANEVAIHTIFEYGELFLFLLVAITYVNALEERRVFSVLRSKLVSLGISYRNLFWLTGTLAFLLSPILDNLTTSLVVGSAIVTLGSGSPQFVALSCINAVVAANAGGVFSPFGDITSLMVWQKGRLSFFEFFHLFLPSVVNYLIPALIMQFWIPKGRPKSEAETVTLKPGAKSVILLFGATILTAVSFKNFLHLQPVLGMMLGFGYLQICSYFLQEKARSKEDDEMVLDSFALIARVEWDTLLFFFGVIFAVRGLDLLGYLKITSQFLYGEWGPTAASVVIGVLSAIVDNIPLMFAVLTMNPTMSDGDWLLITLTTGVGGSLLSIGSAAGVALMGQARGIYTFSAHLRWIWAIALGYAGSIAAHLVINRTFFSS